MQLRGSIAVAAALAMLLPLASCQPGVEASENPSIDYLGQTPPGEIPVVFARGIVSTDYLEHSSPVFSPDGNEVFWSSGRPPEAPGPPGAIMTARREDGGWTEPQVAPFSGTHADDGPFFSPDGSRLYFHSGSIEPGEGERLLDIWFIERDGDGWSEPRALGLVERSPELRFAAMPSIARNGALYFIGHAEGPMNGYGIYCSRLTGGEYAEPELLDERINLEGTLNWTPFIAPDESYLLFSSLRSGHEGDLFISFRSPDGSWSDPEPVPGVNTETQERFPYVSPDGKYLFFTRWTPEHNQDVFWVSASIIDRARAGSD